jgi:transposase
MAGDVRGGDYAAVRRFVFVEGKSRREAARVFGLSRDTVAKMCRYSAPPGYVRSKAPERPKLGLLVPVIDAILESDKTASPKQRHTAKRIFERLRIEHGFAGGYTAVKDYVRLARTGSREVFVPLAHPSGHAQTRSPRLGTAAPPCSARHAWPRFALAGSADRGRPILAQSRN